MGLKISGRVRRLTGAIKFMYEGIPWNFFGPYEPGKTYSAVYEQSLSVGTSVTNPLDLYFSPDGTRLFVLGEQNQSVFSFTLSTPWDISTAVNDNKNFSVGSQDPSPRGLFFRPDGTMMYVVGIVTDNIYAYSMTTPWDVTTASYTNTSLYVGDKMDFPNGIHFSPDGTRLFLVGGGGLRFVFSYVLSTPWDISSAVFEKQKYVPEEGNLTGIYFAPSGERFFTVGDLNDRVNSYSLTTPWDIDTASYDNVSYLVVSQESSPRGLFFASDGTRMFITGIGSDAVISYTPSVN